MIQHTMMRVDLPSELVPGRTVSFSLDWEYNINPSRKVPGRTGAEFFEKDGNWIYCIAQWFPRMAAYTDVNGWQHKQFLAQANSRWNSPTIRFASPFPTITSFPPPAFCRALKKCSRRRKSPA